MEPSLGSPTLQRGMSRAGVFPPSALLVTGSVLQSWEIPPASGGSRALSPAGVQSHPHHLRHDNMSDRDTLLSMGFDPPRVDCECITSCHPQIYANPAYAFSSFLGYYLLCRGVEGDQ